MNESDRLISVLIVADELPQMKRLVEVVERKGSVRFDLVQPADLPESLGPYDVVAMFIHKVLDTRTEQALIGYASSGGRLLVLHHGIASAKNANPLWLAFLGIHIEPREGSNRPWRVVAHTTHTVVNLRPAHFITSNGIDYEREVAYKSCDDPSRPSSFSAFDLPDTEIFLNQHFTDGRSKTVLYGFLCTDPESGETFMQDRAGWIKPAGKGMVIYLQPGHSAHDFDHPVFSQVVHNCLVWDGLDERLRINYPNASGRRNFLAQDPHAWVDLTPPADLAGWTEYDWPPGSPALPPRQPPTWRMDEARRTLVCTGAPHTHLLSQSTYDDFILHVEWRYEPGPGSLNSGVFVRMVPGRRVMHQIETLMDRAGIIMGGRLDNGALLPVSAVVPGQQGEWLSVANHTPNRWTPEIRTVAEVAPPVVPPEYGPSHPKKLQPPGEWNTYEILCLGSRIVVWTNGAISSYTDKCVIPGGSIGFEAEGHPIEFRNIKVKPIYPGAIRSHSELGA